MDYIADYTIYFIYITVYKCFLGFRTNNKQQQVQEPSWTQLSVCLLVTANNFSGRSRNMIYLRTSWKPVNRSSHMWKQLINNWSRDLSKIDFNTD